MMLLPGLVNAHCHLDYTHMAGQLPPQERFSDWLKLIVSIKAGWSLQDYVQSWQAGAEMLLRSGTTTVADIEAVPQLLPGMWAQTPLRVISFLEVIGISKARPAPAVLLETTKHLKRLRRLSFRLGLSPHSPYATSPELLRLSAQAAKRHRLLLASHIAESISESRMFSKGCGDMFDWLQRSGRDMSDCGTNSPVKCVQSCGLLGRNMLAVHLNYPELGDLAILSRKRVHVVHCPRSHFYFKHQSFPLRRVARAGLNLCLGTDSLASVYKHRRETVELSMFAEMQELRRVHPSLAGRPILRMATVNAAGALGLAGDAGVLAKGALADLIALPLPRRPVDLYEAVVRHEGPVAHSMIGGRWVFPRHEL